MNALNLISIFHNKNAKRRANTKVNVKGNNFKWKDNIKYLLFINNHY